ncbi:MAG: pyridoxal phosphate-dependent aminotransferase [Flavobacteriales bacterium]|nr:pyridoxal phosphate-dependent aminotransferase [Flavobacteriales bacterium]
MPAISRKGQQLPASPIRKLVPLAEEARRRGLKVYHLNIGQPDISSPPEAFRPLKEFSQSFVDYSHSAGNMSYRQRLAEYYQSLGLPVEAHDILVTTGGSEALMFTIMSCLDEGDEIIIPEPFYANYNSFSVASGCKVVPVTSRIEEGFALPPLSEFERLITPRTKAILICNPSNPTGYLYSLEELATLASIVEKHNLWLIADEVYRDFVYDGHKHHSILEFESIAEQAVVVDSVSKRFNLCGVRVGCLITRNKDLQATVLRFLQARLSPPSLGQLVAQAALDTPPTYFEDIRREYEQRRNFIVERLNTIPGVVCPKPGGAFYCMVRLPVANAEDFCKFLLQDFSYHGCTVMLAPAAGFYATPQKGLDQVRLAYVLKKEDLAVAADCLEEALKVYPTHGFHSPGD